MTRTITIGDRDLVVDYSFVAGCPETRDDSGEPDYVEIEQIWQEVFQDDGAFGVVLVGRYPADISDDEMDTIVAVLDQELAERSGEDNCDEQD